jgi:hypothetical protein
MSPEPSPRRLLLRSLVIGAVVVATWLLLRAQHGAPPAAAPPGGTPDSAPALASGTTATNPAAPVPGSAASVPVAPAANSEPGAAGAATSAAPAEVPTPATSVDERQDAKISRGLTSNAEGGLLVASAPPASVAAALRLQPGDVILTVNGSAVSTPADFVRVYREQGMPSELTILRAGHEVHVH